MMNKQFAELQVYQLGGGIAFGLPGTTTPFLALPSGQATIKPWGTSGFLFENILTGDVIAFVSEYDDVLDNSDAPYGVDQPAVFTALAAFFFDVAGGGSSDLQTVLGLGNYSGPFDIDFRVGNGIVFSNLSRLKEGTIDAGLGGSNGIAQICGLGYELKWEGGVLYVMGSSGNTIRQSFYNFGNTPTVNDDSTLGYLSGSRWSLDNGDTYVCTDETVGAAVWVKEVQPGAGSGGGGQFYYFNYGNTTGISPTTGLPTSPVSPSQLGINYSTGSGSITSANLTQGSYSLVCGFVTIVGTPGVTDIPAGLWDFNIWADILGGSGSTNQTQFQIRVYKYDGANAPTLLASSDDIYVYDPTTTAQYIGNVTMPQTTILATDRIYIELWAQKNVNQSRQIRFYFDSLHPSHVHTTIPSVAGTGLVKVVSGVYQSPASLLVNADVSASAGIAVSKLAPLPIEIQVACSDETTAITAGTNKVTFRMPHAMTLTSVRASLTTAQASGSIFTVDINEAGTSILSTKLTIDNTEKTSVTAATPAVISDTALADDAEITIDIDQIGNGTATGLKLTLIGTR
jgi:hypothetical protein